METLTSLVSNLGFLGLALVCVFLFSIKANLPQAGLRQAIAQGVIYGLAAVLVVSFPVYGPNGELFDARAAPIVIAGFFGGPIAGLIAATIGAIDRFALGGPLVWGGVATFYFYLSAALVWRYFFKVPSLNLAQSAGLATLATVFVIPAFFMRPSFETSLIILQSYWGVLLIVNLIGTILMGMIFTEISIFTNKQKEHQAIIESSADGIVTVNSNQIITAVNPASEKMFGWTAKEIIGRGIANLVPAEYKSRHPGFASGFLDQQEVTSRQMTEYRTIQAQRKDGSTFPVLVSLAKFMNAGQTTVVATVHDMTEIQEARTKLRHMTDTLATRLRESLVANESKNLFLASMSHELRTPLNAIIGFSSLIESIGSSNIKHSKLDEYIRDIKYSGETLLVMINDVLDISVIESGKTEVLIEPHSVKEIVSDVVLLTKIKANERQVILNPAGSPDISIPCDMRTLKQALLNLVTNAIKFSPAGATVRIQVETTPDSVQLSVEDTGSGIPDTIIHRLGEPFLRGDTTEARSIEGTGLGLALSKKFVERQGGTLTVARRKEGGTIATITMPLSAKTAG